jgi:hypothetical protein
MSISADWIYPVGLGILGSLIVLLMKAPKPVPVRIKSHRRRK